MTTSLYTGQHVFVSGELTDWAGIIRGTAGPRVIVENRNGHRVELKPELLRDAGEPCPHCGGVNGYHACDANERGELELRVVMTADEAELLYAAIDTLKAIRERVEDHSHKVPSSGTSVRAQDYGRVAGVAYVAADAIFAVINTSSSHCNDTAAAAILDTRLGR